MDDRMKGREVLMAGFVASARGGVEFTDEYVDRIAAKARELFGPDKFELEVIEAALGLAPQALAEYRLGTKLKDHIEALRDSRKPKPRYYVDSAGGRWYINDNVTGRVPARCDLQVDAEKIADLLNQAESKGT